MYVDFVKYVLLPNPLVFYIERRFSSTNNNKINSIHINNINNNKV